MHNASTRGSVGHESAAVTYARDLPIIPVKARGARVRDSNGRWYLDCLSAAGAMSLGWNHPVVTEAIQRTLRSGAPLLTLDFHHPLRDAFVDDLLATLPPQLANDCVVHLCSPSGANAVEAALMLAEIATGGRDHVGVQGGFHGCSRAARGVSSGGGLRQQPVALSTASHFLPFPQDYRCPFGRGGQAGTDLAIEAVRHLFTSPHSGLRAPASVLMEFVLGEGGVIPAVPAWAQEVRRAATMRQIPLIADEVQAGMYRTGSAWAFERCGVEPDMIAISKGLGSGIPIAVLVIRRKFDVWGQGAFTGTFRGNTLAFAAASAVLRYATRCNLGEHVTDMGVRLARGLTAIAGQDASIIGDVRVVGLMAGVEIIDPGAERDARGTGVPAPKLAAAVQAACLESGLIVEIGGQYSNVVRFLPPLTITDTEIEEVLDRFHDAVQRVQSRLASDKPAELV
ncbi:aspartate aminotransferase family protein [Mycobacterium intermedium]|uniref:Diaminobutyrate--2-oxoglutarate transaminase n=1 Tax=Mycobacterium intermedium TaxID=28445 RepID=A0A1E3SKU2_MYCIE|nr:aminotransferase class III-fold pyridoxal phosphate-dependent enzyme [Mycobacterium intermedium]ODR02731.1 4-aminobutyrate aminotransferase [Mycobacterium intermedium]OPE51988.1 aspartate aminotransferase family protein [Mycobacterium intermedium]ORB10392.1 aspartate aminotransferase family protein [Mycobacterium intermedium]